VIRSGPIGDKEFSIQAKCRQLIADAFFGFRRGGFDCAANFLQRSSFVRAHTREIVIVSFGLCWLDRSFRTSAFSFHLIALNRCGQ
jgi:hypothetical protein